MDRTIGEWQLISDLGEGGFGVVSLWKNHNTKKALAIKRCKKVELSSKQRERWCNEVKILKTLKHRNIISYEDLPFELEEGIKNPFKLPLLSMEYCSGGNLRHVLQRPRNYSGLQEIDVRTILKNMTEALQYLHQQDIVHRDFKPENIVLKESPEEIGGVVYKLIDLGFAKELSDTLSIVGTMDYVAPEILRGQKYNFSVDYWSFGIVAYEIICGNKKYPFLFPTHVSVPERLEYLKKKHDNHICLYRNSRDTISYSSRINQKCHLSSWLKEEIEKWLQKPLQFDGIRRSKFNPLEELKVLLTRKILTVFSVYTLQFYYYEINECILISTLKTWIYRDTKTEPADQLLLTGKCLYSDEDLLINILPHEDSVIYVFNKHFSWSSFAKLPSPDFLQNNMNTVEKLTALSSTVYCLLNERKHFLAVTESLLHLQKHIKISLCEAYTHYECLYLMFHKMVMLMEFSNNIRKKGSVGKEMETNFSYLIAIVQNIREKIVKVEDRIAKIKLSEKIVNKGFQDLNTVLKHHLAELERKINKAAADITSVSKNEAGKVAFSCVSDTIKKRRETLRYLKSEAKAQTFLLEETPKMREWITGLLNNVQKTISSLEILQVQRYELISKTENVADTYTIKNDNGYLDYRKLIKDNKATRIRLEEAINSGLNRFRVQCEFIETFLHKIPKC